MLVPYIRSSSYGNWDFCQLQYYQIYVLGYQNKSGLKAELGTATHKVMEILGNCKKILQDEDARKTHTFIDDAIGEVKFTNKSLNTDDFVDSLIKRSYDTYRAKSTNDWDNPKFKVPVDDKWIRDTYEFVSTLVHKGVKDWNGFCDPRTRNILAMEPHFDLPIERDWAHFSYKDRHGGVQKGQLAIKGTIDMVTQPKPNTIEVIDWKTGERKDFATGEEKDYSKLMKDPQLLLYNHALSRLYPEVENRIMTINFLRSGGPFSMNFDKEDDDRFLEMLRKRFIEINNTSRPQPVSQDRSSWKCKYVCAFSETDENGEMRCTKVENEIKTYGIETATANLKRKNFDPTFYSAPG